MASSSPAQDRDSQLLEVGKRCSDPSCLLVDFLPFKCHHCEFFFCQDHFKVDVHQCPKYDENKYNRVAPNCPLCNIPVAVRPGQDPNVRMDIHLDKECSVVTGKVKSKSTPTCARGNCKKVLFSPIRCDKCKAQFCAAHRFPQDHNCSTPAQSSRLANLNTGARNLNSKASLAGAVKSMSSIATSTSRPVQPSASSSKTSFPFNKTDRLSVLPSSITTVTIDPDADSNPTTSNVTNVNNDTDNKPQSIIDAFLFIPRPIFVRARSERESRIKAMQARAKKGLLSEEEMTILAELEAAIKQEGCVIM